MKIVRNIFLVITCASLIGCGSSDVSNLLSAAGIQTLSAGQTVTVDRNDSYAVPAGTTLRAPNGNIINISGQDGSFTTPNGSVISVSASATGRASNIVTGK